MELLQLKYFLAVAECEHVTEAAHALNVAQPSISQSISRLENELNVKLFDRKGRSVQLNEYGRLFYVKVKSALQILEEGVQELDSMAQAEKVSLTVSFWNSSNMIPTLLESFCEKHPNVSIRAVSGTGEEGYQFQFSFSSGAMPPQPCVALLQEEVFLAVPLSSPLAKYDSIPLTMAKEYPFISLSQTLPFRKLTDEFCRLAGFEQQTIMENENYMTLKKLLGFEAGIAFFPQKTWGAVDKSKFKLVRIETPVCSRTIYLSWPKDYQLSGYERLFRDFAIGYFAQFE